MKRKLFTLSLLVLFLGTLTLRAQDLNNLTGSLLWKITGNGLSSPSYVLGTHHLTDAAFVDSIPGLRKVMVETAQTVGELLLSDQADLQNRLMASAMMPEGESYKAMLSEEDYKTLDKALLESLGGGLDQLGLFKPGFISMMYTIVVYAKYNPGINLQKMEAIDSYVLRISEENDKTVLGLETVEEQIHILFDLEPLKQQTESLVCLVKNEKFAGEFASSLTKYYRDGLLKEMYNDSFNNSKDPCPASKVMETALLKTRNDNWLKKLPGIMKEKSTLVAVGALHLTGEEGLLYQLSKMGYTVEPVKN